MVLNKNSALETGGGRGREGRSHARQGLNCRRRSRLLCRPLPVRSFQGSPGGPKLVAKPPGAVPSTNRNPASPARTTGKGPRSKYVAFTSPPRPSSTGRSTLHPTAPVEPPATAAVPVEQVAQKRKASSPLPPRTVTRPTSPPSPTRWEIARSRTKGRFKDYITPPVDNIADLPRKPASHRWQILPEEMGKINIGLEDRSRSVLVITNFHGELFQQVVIDKTVDNATAHSLLMSLLGDGYRMLLPSLNSLHTQLFWLQLSDSSPK